MSGNIQFITETTIGPKERRLIRSHVMKGKNAGRPRPSRKSLRHVCTKHQYIRHPTLLTQDQFEANALEVFYNERYLGMKQLMWNDLTLTSFPHQLSPESRHLVYQCKQAIYPLSVGLSADYYASSWTVAKLLYPPEFCLELDLSQYAWFQYVLQDKACKLHLCRT
jgi:hypothetical protein